MGKICIKVSNSEITFLTRFTTSFIIETYEFMPRLPLSVTLRNILAFQLSSTKDVYLIAAALFPRPGFIRKFTKYLFCGRYGSDVPSP